MLAPFGDASYRAAMTPDDEVAKARLAALRAEIETMLTAARDASAPVPLDQATIGRVSRIDAMQQREMAVAARKARQRDLVRIEMAERRLASGDYGCCVDCGEAIAPKRLAIDPMAERCVNCAR